jgi:predicted dehydrogenase
MINIGVIGYGYWGPNLVRNFSESGVADVTWVSDLSEDRLALVRSRYPATKTTVEFGELFADPELDAVAIATPVSTHFDLALKALQAGKHVFLEKPLTETSEQARQLISEAKSRGLVLMVDHTFIFTGAVRKVKELIESGEIGDIYYYDSTRVNLGLVQTDVNVIWDLAVHDLAIMDYIFKERPVAVSATGMSHIPNRPANIAHMSLFFESPMIANIQVNWLAPVKLRQTLIGGSQKMIVFDDLEPSEKIKIYDKGITLGEDKEGIYKTLVGYRTGDMWAPKLDSIEALGAEARYFVECIEEGKTPVNDGDAGLTVVRILEAATQSMQERGRPIELAE